MNETFTDILLRYAASTDKQTVHSYGPLYNRWLAPLRGRACRILEFGVSMFGGGDLLALADFLPETEVWGVDTDLAPLAAEVSAHPRITAWSADAYADDLPQRLALGGHCAVIIDDCVHDPERQELLFRRFWPLIGPDGQYVVEDMGPESRWLFDRIGQTVGRRGRVEFYDLSAERPACPDNRLIRVVRL